MFKPENICWDELFPPSSDDVDLATFAPFHHDKTILVTGAGGSIGTALVRALAKLAPSQLVLADSSEQSLYSIHKDLLSHSVDHIPVLGSVADDSCMHDVFARFRPEIVYHAAASKHVPLGEMNPFAVVENNIFGTAAIAELSQEFCTKTLVMISTDKSVAPESIMGASKRMAEMLVQAQANSVCRMTSIRLGNVIGSEGSVVPLFLEQIARGGPVTVTDSEAERYFMTMDSSVLRVFAAAADCPADPAVAIPILGKPVKIADLARFLIEQSRARDIRITFTGLRPGDKLHEEFVTPGESISHETGNLLQWLRGPQVSKSRLTQCLAQLRAAVHDRDLARLLAALVEQVPEYRPSLYLQERAGVAVS